MEWLEVEKNWVLTPPRAKAVIHFLGGAFLAVSPHVAYKRLLEALAQTGYVIVATPFLNTFDHRQIALDVYRSYRLAENKLFLDYFPVFGMGHSMGCKIHLLMDSWFDLHRQGNIFMAYNNYSAYRSIPFFENLVGTLPEIREVEFTPSPQETIKLIKKSYSTAYNLLIKFQDDEIDEIPELAEILQAKFRHGVQVAYLAGNHITPVAVDVQWQAGEVFSPIDAIAQWLKQEWNQNINRDNLRLEQVILHWLHRQLSQAKVAV
jgi:hypothetical protein